MEECATAMSTPIEEYYEWRVRLSRQGLYHSVPTAPTLPGLVTYHSCKNGHEEVCWFGRDTKCWYCEYDPLGTKPPIRKSLFDV